MNQPVQTAKEKWQNPKSKSKFGWISTLFWAVGNEECLLGFRGHALSFLLMERQTLNRSFRKKSGNIPYYAFGRSLKIYFIGLWENVIHQNERVNQVWETLFNTGVGAPVEKRERDFSWKWWEGTDPGTILQQVRRFVGSSWNGGKRGVPLTLS